MTSNQINLVENCICYLLAYQQSVSTHVQVLLLQNVYICIRTNLAIHYWASRLSRSIDRQWNASLEWMNTKIYIAP